MRKFVLTALSFSLLLATGCDNPQRIARLEKDNAEMKAQLEKQNATASLATQEKCSSAAKAFFKEGWGGGDALTELLTFQNHFDRKQNRCYILVEWHYRFGPKLHSWINHISIHDVFENNEYATFAENHYLDTPPGLAIPDKIVTCIVTGTKCKSIDEFNKLASPLMND